MRAPFWPRPRFEPGGPAGKMAFLVFSAAPFPTPDDGTMPRDFTDWCPFDGWHPGFTWGYRSRSTSAQLFAKMETGAEMAVQAPSTGMTHALLASLRSAQFGAQITGTWDDAPDLGALQFGWAMVRWLLASGAEVVLDLETTRWWSRAEILSRQPEGWVGHPFSLEREIQVNEWPRPDVARWVISTHGMTKFGRPDVVLEIESEERDVHAETRTASLPGWARETVVQLANEWALGAMPKPEFRLGSMHFELRPSAEQPGALELVRR